MIRLLVRWVISAFSIWVAVKLVPGIVYSGPAGTLLLIALVFGLVNALVRPLLTLLSCPLVILTLGLFLLVINALMLQLTAWIIGPHFIINGFWPALWGSLIISIVSGILNVAIKDDHERKDRHD